MFTLNGSRTGARAAAWTIVSSLVCGQMVYAARPVVRVTSPAAGNCPDGNCYSRPVTYGYYATRWKKWPGSDGLEASPLRPAPEEVTAPPPAGPQKPPQPRPKTPITTIPEDEEDTLPSAPDDTLPGLPGKSPVNPFQDEEELPSLDPLKDDDLSSRQPQRDMAARARSAPSNPLRSVLDRPAFGSAGPLRTTATAGSTGDTTLANQSPGTEPVDSPRTASRGLVNRTGETAADSAEEPGESVARLPDDTMPADVSVASHWQDAQWPELANWETPAEPDESESAADDDDTDADDDNEMISASDDSSLIDAAAEEAKQLADDGYEISVSDDGASPLPAASIDLNGPEFARTSRQEATAAANESAKSSRRSRAAARPPVDAPRRVVVGDLDSADVNAEHVRATTKRDKRGLGANPLRLGKPRFDPAVAPAAYHTTGDLPEAWLETGGSGDNPLRSR